jgi:hypothetical protein
MCDSTPVSSEAVDASSILQEMAEVASAAQRALLGGELQSLECNVLRQRLLCCQLQAWLKERGGNSPFTAELGCTAIRARHLNRVLMSLLRKMRSNLEILRKARRPSFALYEAVARDDGER